MQRIDSHQHFWRYSKSEYGWITDEMADIRKDFLPPDLKPELDQSGFHGTVAVQARESTEETLALLRLADEYPDVIQGVVGWVPLAAPDLEETLLRLSGEKALRGVRHLVQGERDPDFLSRADFNRGIAALRRHGLVYDILIFERQLAATIAFVDRHPDQVFVLDHIAKPKIGAGLLEPWARQIRDLALRPNVYCKLSGMVTEADYHSWRPEQLTPYMDVVLEAFGPHRLLFGSDWPVCLVAATYSEWANLVQQYLSRLTLSEQDAIFGGTATQVYGLPASHDSR
jgi:L-fuconolactonase